MCPAQLPDELADLDDLCRVQADRRLVQNDEPGTAQQCLCNAHPLLVALGKAADEPGQNGFQPGTAGSPAHLLLPFRLFHTLQLGGKGQVLLHRHFRVKGRLFGQIAHTGLGGIGLLGQRVPCHRHLPTGGREIAGEDVHNGGFARAVGPQQTTDLAICHGKRDIVHGKMIAVLFGEMRNFDHVHNAPF